MAYNLVGDVVTRAIEIAQLDSSFLPLARQYYNLGLNDQGSSFDWLQYRIQLSDQVLANATPRYDLPSDYSRSDTCYLIDQNNNATPIIIVSKYRFDQQQSGTLTGDPRIAYIDLRSRQIVFNCNPSSTRYYRLTYFRLPIMIDDSGGDDGDDCDFENPLGLIYLIASMLMDYTDDERAPAFGQKADKLIHDNMMNQADEDNNSIVELGPNFRPGSRPTRGGGWGSSIF